MTDGVLVVKLVETQSHAFRLLLIIVALKIENLYIDAPILLVSQKCLCDMIHISLNILIIHKSYKMHWEKAR